jgi:DNA-binding PadR family transcriptional regulator
MRKYDSPYVALSPVQFAVLAVLTERSYSASDIMRQITGESGGAVTISRPGLTKVLAVLAGHRLIEPDIDFNQLTAANRTIYRPTLHGIDQLEMSLRQYRRLIYLANANLARRRQRPPFLLQ